ncbi:fumarate hydratase [Peredibacter starrii]|uniref:Fumarate hydratase n=1 Tax=Peredibacter starrii TaxID=28202 RepID=A0AAX4HV18_9BACT|nr:fumarate hydratase [Peredibacter starrii]WPU67124.1 fumarate hydratase [Peredibacter starrii]
MTKKVATKRPVKKAVAKKPVKKVLSKKVPAAKKIDPKTQTIESLLELIRITSTVVPDDVAKTLMKARSQEEQNTTASYAMNIIKDNMDLAKFKSQPLCQDTGTVIFFVYHPPGFFQNDFKELIKKAVVKATQKGYLRQNSVNSLTGENAGTNLGEGHPSIHFYETKGKEVEVKLVLKGGGCENVSAQYSLPDTTLGAGRDLEGVRKVVIDAVYKAQGKGCGPGALGVCIGGDRADSAYAAKKQLLRKLDDKNTNADLAKLESEIVETCNKLGIGPMGFGGKTTLISCKMTHANRVPASFFVSISYMCWAFRRQGVVLDAKKNTIKKWLY